MASSKEKSSPKSVPKAAPATTSKGVSSPMLRLIRITRGIGILFGGLVTLIGVMGVVGLATSNFLARLLVALVLVVGIPAFAADRVMKKTKLGGGLGMVGDVFAIVLLAIALVLVLLEFVSKPLFVGEGNHYSKSGSRGMARFSYWLGGATPVFPEERGQPAQVTPGASGSASAGPTDGGK